MTFAKLLARTAGSGPARLDPEARFRSPYSEYVGRAQVSHLFGLIEEVLTDVEIERRFEDAPAAIAVFSARAGDVPVDGSLLTVANDRGELSEVTLVLRPFAGVKSALAQMQVRLEERPLPACRRARRTALCPRPERRPLEAG